MTVRAAAANPAVLRWARERAGLSAAEVAARLKRPPADIQGWESGRTAPTFLQLETLAERVYHRPLALFFLPRPPEEESPQHEFRTLPDFEVAALSDDTRYAIRLGTAYQRSLVELTGGVNPAHRLVFRDLRAELDSDEVDLAHRLRAYLGVSVAEQRTWPGARDAMSHWREAVEASGVFVFKRAFKQDEVSGFSLMDDTFPIVMVNNGTAFTRQIFTLFHELAHLLYGVSSLTKVDPGFVDRFTGAHRRLELACNRLASEFLVPGSLDLPARVDHVQAIRGLATEYCVSREVILRKLVEQGTIPKSEYRPLLLSFSQESRDRAESGGGNYYLTQRAYLGSGFLQLAFSRYRAGLVSIGELAEHLGMKAKNISTFEDYVLSSG